MGSIYTWVSDNGWTLFLICGLLLGVVCFIKLVIQKSQNEIEQRPTSSRLVIPQNYQWRVTQSEEKLSSLAQVSPTLQKRYLWFLGGVRKNGLRDPDTIGKVSARDMLVLVWNIDSLTYLKLVLGCSMWSIEVCRVNSQQEIQKVCMHGVANAKEFLYAFKLIGRYV